MRLLSAFKQPLVLFLVVTSIAACGRIANESEETGEPIAPRWYSAEQVQSGRQVFLANCASCHGESAQGLTPDWKAKLPDGSFPPPPLDGSAHAWHHPLSVLMGVINDGGEALGGKMPGFKTVLTEPEKLAAIAFFQNYWTDEIYGNWLKMGGSN